MWPQQAACRCADLAASADSLKAEKDTTAKLTHEVDELEGTVRQMTAEAASQAAAALALGESAKEAKARAEAAHQRV
jgi:hypothetical protein